ncbi:MAG: phytoene/squalene synthase family protein [Pseudomonadota bacterium]
MMDPVVEHARQTIEKGSKSFAVAARVFDETTRANAYMLYAWCRYCDDCIDGQELGHGQQSPGTRQQLSMLANLRADTRAALSGSPPDQPVYQGLARVFRDCEIDAAYAEALLDGFEMDVDKRRYRTLDDLMLYCYRVAGVVGAMMASIMGVRDARVLARAVDLGLAFQLTNIARDVLEDAGDNRIYLPLEWLAEAGIAENPTTFADHQARLAPLAARLLSNAETYYESAKQGITHLPPRCAWAISAALLIYREIGILLLAAGDDAWAERRGASTARKMVLLTKGAGLATSRKLASKVILPRPATLWPLPAPLGRLLAEGESGF